jgi:hypothetical protein
MTLNTDRADIIELFSLYADIADTKSFDELPRRVHADPFTMNFESVTGMPPMQVALNDYVMALRSSFDAFIATHHSITGHVISIDGDHAIARAHVRAEHWLPAEGVEDGTNCWLVVGFYDNEAVRTPDGWRFSKVELTAAYQENAHLLAAATS